MDTAARRFESLPSPMQVALELAWESAVAGSFGVGAVVVGRDQRIVTTGRNRLLESDPGDDPLAGSSIAHAEMNALAKIPFRGRVDDDLHLYTTLQPCLQCAGAIRLSQVERVTALVSDPLWPELDGSMRDLNEFTARNWPESETLDAGGWAVFSLVHPTMKVIDRPRLRRAWSERVPAVVELADELRTAGWPNSAAGMDIVGAARTIWPSLESAAASLASG